MADDRLNIPDRVWQTYEQMAREIGAEIPSLVNQALFLYARLNGYVVPGTHATLPLAVGEVARVSIAEASTEPANRPIVPPPPALSPEVQSAQERVMAKAAELERLVSGGASRSQDVLADRDIEDDDKASTLAGDERLIVDDSLLGEDAAAMAPPPPAPAPAAVVVAAAAGAPSIVCDGQELGRVTKERYLIGRGKHCDLVIPSGKVSREHAAIVKAPDGWYMEDLGSSNGTWFDKRRISRRKIQNGDEYYICSEKITVQL